LLLIKDDALDLALPAGVAADPAFLALLVGQLHFVGPLPKPGHEQLLDGAALLDGRDLHMEVGEVIDLV
jgi:hypothetical protein